MDQDLSVTKTKVEQLQNELNETSAKSAHDFDLLYRKIVYIVLLKSGMGNESDVKDIRETTVALESVFPPSELRGFLGSTREDKMANLNRWTELVIGIRLFNKHLGKGGENIQDCK